MTHLDLFSGIGGFAYAADQVWDDVTHIFCDNDPFCQKVLAKHWPESEIYGDIRQLTADSNGEWQSQSKRVKPKSGEWLGDGIDLVTGGFPCQPFSAAGLRRGTADDRHLWPEMLRVIRLAKPKWVIAENVRGILTWNEGMVFEEVCTDLEAAGYEVQPFIIPAVAVNAPHRRDRVWFVAKLIDTAGNGLPRSGNSTPAKQSRRPKAKPDTADKHAANANQHGFQKSRSEQQAGGDRQFDEATWDADWSALAAELCSVDDGLPVELDGFKLTKSQHRKEQIKAYGNAIVPQVAIEIMKGML